MNKKSMFYNIALVFAFLAALTLAAISLGQTNSEVTSQAVGLSAMNLFYGFQQGENALFFVDQSAKLASCSAIVEAAKAVGGKITNATRELSGAEAKTFAIVSFGPAMNSALNQYLDYSKTKSGYLFQQQNYEFLVEGNQQNSTIKGFASKPLSIDILSGSPDGGKNGSYSIMPSFSLQLSYSFDIYSTIMASVNEITKYNLKYNCTKEPLPQLVKMCVADAVADLNNRQTALVWEASPTDNENITSFKVTQNINIQLCSQKPVTEFQLKIQPTPPSA